MENSPDARPLVSDEAVREVWDNATNAVCQEMQARAMCNCPDGDCLAAKVEPSPADLTAALPHMGGAVAIKPLEWEYVERATMTYTAHWADGDVAYYIDQGFGSDSYYFRAVRWPEETIYDGDDLEAAKAAAQADYEARIRSALVAPAPAVTEAVAWTGSHACDPDATECDLPSGGGGFAHPALSTPTSPPASPADDRLREVVEALEPFASVGELIEVETEGFADSDELELLFADHLFERITVGKFRRARAALVSLRSEREG